MSVLGKKTGLLIVALLGVFVCGFCATDAHAKYTSTDGKSFKLTVRPQYTVVFHANGGDGEMADQTFTYGVEQALMSNSFTRANHYFMGWDTVAEGGGDLYDDSELVTFSMTSSGTIDLYAQWEEGPLRTVFRHDGACIFGGENGTITGDECADYAGQTYIDTGVELYNPGFYDADYEIGFTIVYYNPSNDENVLQATFMNSKWENAGASYPGLVVRKSGTNKIEFTQTINGVKAQPAYTISGVVENMDVVVTRIDDVVYYSINGGGLRLLQSMKNTSDYIPDEEDITVWFGAASGANNAPFRVLKGTLSNMYVKVGEPRTKYTVTFNAQNGTSPDITEERMLAGHEFGELPVPTWDNDHFFDGWNTEPDGSGEKITRATKVNGDMTIYAQWSDNKNVCSVNGVEKETVQECINAAGNTPTPIVLMKDTAENTRVAAGQNITFDLAGHIMYDNSQQTQDAAVIFNYGTVTIENGTFMSSQEKTAVINNASTGRLYVSGNATVMAIGQRQAIYNDGGWVEISGDAYLSSRAPERAAVHNLSSGTLIVTGGTIVSELQQGINNASGTLIIGNEDGLVDSTTPIIRGATYGVTTNSNISMFDGKLMGTIAYGAINNEARLLNIEAGSELVHGTESIDGVTYQTLYYTK